jgi:hypothetical protein
LFLLLLQTIEQLQQKVSILEKKVQSQKTQKKATSKKTSKSQQSNSDVIGKTKSFLYNRLFEEVEETKSKPGANKQTSQKKSSENSKEKAEAKN